MGGKYGVRPRVLIEFRLKIDVKKYERGRGLDSPLAATYRTEQPFESFEPRKTRVSQRMVSQYNDDPQASILGLGPRQRDPNFRRFVWREAFQPRHKSAQLREVLSEATISNDSGLPPVDSVDRKPTIIQQSEWSKRYQLLPKPNLPENNKPPTLGSVREEDPSV
ncbi:hypothetical protein WN51_13498 [Melipona quadrifasciata]|uniref:Uncharacterized protein n=1 Tax=Melipona quadrifasciata TaxID=166423 RepID=A0A0M9A0Y8_9HYME|nr:hypothetical protein WN51_13498 [Melipona quadrifasciata]